jgi:RNA polymerase sigma-70 factor (family 1)
MSLPELLTETEWLRRMKNGDEQAFRELYRLYSPRLYGNLLKLVKNDTIARELLQDIFIRIWNHRRDIDPQNSFRAYCFRIAANLVTDFFRKAARDRKLAAHLKATASDCDHCTEQSIDYKESNDLLQQAIRRLPPQRRQVFELCKMEGKSYAEVSLLLGISTSTISDHIVKASRTIKEYFFQSGESIILVILFNSLFL